MRVADTYLELKMLCLFYFDVESEKMAIISGLRYLKKILFIPFLFLLFFLFQFPMSIDSSRSSLMKWLPIMIS